MQLQTQLGSFHGVAPAGSMRGARAVCWLTTWGWVSLLCMPASLLHCIAAALLGGAAALL